MTDAVAITHNNRIPVLLTVPWTVIFSDDATRASAVKIWLFKAGFADAIKDRYAIGTSTKAVVEEETEEEDTAADND